VAPTFDSLEDARVFLLTQARDKVVRTTESARFHGKIAETMPPGEIRRAIEGALERQRKFPLDTANALRGRLRREHFTIFKKGSKGVSYVCAVKRKFRVPGQTFADSIGALISFIEGHPMIRASELPTKFLGITLPAPVKGSGGGSGTRTCGGRCGASRRGGARSRGSRCARADFDDRGTREARPHAGRPRVARARRLCDRVHRWTALCAAADGRGAQERGRRRRARS
jgi:hypothetical protein